MLWGLLFLISPFLALAENSEIDAQAIEEKIDQLNDKIEAETEKKESIASQLEKISNNIATTKAEISRTEKILSEYDVEIAQKERTIGLIEENIAKYKKQLADFLRIYRRAGLEINFVFIDKSADIGNYFSLISSYEKIQEKIKISIDNVHQEKEALEQERDIIDAKKQDVYEIFQMQQEQKRALEYEEAKKDYMLGVAEGKLKDLTDERSELRRQLDALQSLGNPINLENAIKTAEWVESKTKVRAAFLLGVLRVESNMGQNVGGGRYKTDMHPSQQETFKSICKDLGYDPKDRPVSKRVCYNPKAKDGCGGWGGAMGPAQFMPTTWIGYVSKIKSLTGNKKADPWDLKDAMVAMGLKLSQVSGVTSGKRSAEKQAASMYLAGGNWQNYTWYGDRVLYYADGFEKYMKD